MFSFVFLVVIASISGAIGARLAGQKAGGCLTSIVLGFIGGLLGQWLARQFDIGLGPTVRDFPILWAIIGASLFVAAINLISGRKR